MFEGICDVLHREMEMLEEKYATSKTPMNAQDLEHIDKIAHALKSIASYEVMKDGYDSGYTKVRSRRYYPDEYRRY